MTNYKEAQIGPGEEGYFTKHVCGPNGQLNPCDGGCCSVTSKKYGDGHSYHWLNFQCTRPAGHEGTHAAHMGTTGDLLQLATWED